MASRDLYKAFTSKDVDDLKNHLITLHQSPNNRAYEVINDNQNADKETLLHKAVKKKWNEKIKLLIRYGADVTKQQVENGDTPLHVAAFLGYKETVEALLYTQHLDDYRQCCTSQGVCKCGLNALKITNIKGRKPVAKGAVNKVLKEEEILYDVRNVTTAVIPNKIYRCISSLKESIDVSEFFYYKLMITGIELGNMNLLAFTIFKITEEKHHCVRGKQDGVSQLRKMLKGDFLDSTEYKSSFALTEHGNCGHFGNGVKDAILSCVSPDVPIFIDVCLKVLMGEDITDEYVSEDVWRFLAVGDNIRLVLSATSNVKQFSVKNVLLQKLIIQVDGRAEIEWSHLDMNEVDDMWLEPFIKIAAKLDVSRNRLSTVPSKVPDFHDLRSVNFSYNRLTKVPSSLFELQLIYHIDLSHNSINELPDDVKFSGSLLKLSLNNNILVSLPKSMERAVISELNLGYNQFESLPYCLVEMPMLQHLQLDGNKKILWFPNEIGKMRSDISISLKDMDQLMYPLSLCQQDNMKKLLLHHLHKLHKCCRNKQMNLILVSSDDKANSDVFNKLCPNKKNADGYHSLTNKGVLKKGHYKLMVVKLQAALTFSVVQCYLTEPLSLYVLVWDMKQKPTEALTSCLNTLAAFNPNGNVMIVGVGTASNDKKNELHDWLTRHSRYSSMSFGVHEYHHKNQLRLGKYWFVMLDECNTKSFKAGTLKKKVFAVATSLKDLNNNEVILGYPLPSFYFNVSKRILKSDSVVFDQERLVDLIRTAKKSSCSCVNTDESQTFHLRDSSEIVKWLQEQGTLVNFQKASLLDGIYFSKRLFDSIQDYTGSFNQIHEIEGLLHYKTALHKALRRNLDVFQIVQGSGWRNVTFTNIGSLNHAIECIALEKQPDIDEAKEFYEQLRCFGEDTFDSSDEVNGGSQDRYEEIKVFHSVKNKFVQRNMESPIGLAHCRFHVFKVVPLKFWLDLMFRVIEYNKKWLTLQSPVHWKYGICFQGEVIESEISKTKELFIELTQQVRSQQCYISCKVVTDNRQRSESIIADYVNILMSLAEDWKLSKKSGFQLNENGIEQYALCLHHLDNRPTLIPSCLYSYLQNPKMRVECPYMNHTHNPKDVLEVFPDYAFCDQKVPYKVVSNADMFQGKDNSIVYTLSEGNCIEAFYKFKKDISMYARVGEHPNICSAKEIQFDGGIHLKIVMELPPESISNQWSNVCCNKKLDSVATFCICFQLASVLEHLHGLEIIHQNLNPSNIRFVNADGDITIKIVDFSEASYFTSSGLQFCNRNPLYQPPEVLIQQLDCSKPMDIWAYGMVIYQLLTGVPPFSEPSQTIIEHLKSGGKPVFPSERRKALPLETLVKMCWEYNPMKRPSASQLLEFLKSPRFQLLMDVSQIKGDGDFNTALLFAGLTNERLIMFCSQQLFVMDISKPMVAQSMPTSHLMEIPISFCEIGENIIAFASKISSNQQVSYNIRILQFNEKNVTNVILCETYDCSFKMFCGVDRIHMFFDDGSLKTAVMKDGVLDWFDNELLLDTFVERFESAHVIESLNGLFVSVCCDSEYHWDLNNLPLEDGFRSWIKSKHLILVNTNKGFCLCAVDNQKLSLINHDDSFEFHQDEYISAFLVIDHQIFWIGTSIGRIMICRIAENISLLKMVHPYKGNVDRLILMTDGTNKQYVISYAQKLQLPNLNLYLESIKRESEDCSDLLLLWHVYNEDEIRKLDEVLHGH